MLYNAGWLFGLWRAIGSLLFTSTGIRGTTIATRWSRSRGRRRGSEYLKSGTPPCTPPTGLWEPSYESGRTRSRENCSRMIRVLTGHGCFGEYLSHRQKTHHAVSSLHGQDSTQTIQMCPAWGEERRDLVLVMGQDLTPNIDVSHAWEREDIEGGLLLLWTGAAKGNDWKEEREDLSSEQYSEGRENEQCLLLPLHVILLIAGRIAGESRAIRSGLPLAAAAQPPRPMMAAGSINRLFIPAQ